MQEKSLWNTESFAIGYNNTIPRVTLLEQERKNQSNREEDSVMIQYFLGDVDLRLACYVSTSYLRLPKS